jgi:uncharacterized membrane protein
MASENTPADSRSDPVQAQRNIESITRLEENTILKRSPAEHVADRITSLAGSTLFLLIHVVFFGFWMITNVGLIPALKPFDPFPFSLLTLMVSLEVIILTLLVLMNQNRMIKEADKRTHLDLQLSMLAEQESTLLLKLVQGIGRHLGVEVNLDQSEQELATETDIHSLAEKLDEHLPD